MPIRTTGRCRLCGAEQEFSDMAHFTSAVIGPLTDLSLMESETEGAVSWFCFKNNDCWHRARSDPRWHDPRTGRVWKDHDRFKARVVEQLRNLPAADLDNMREPDHPGDRLPNGRKFLRAENRLARSQIDRFHTNLRNRLEAEDLTPEDAEICLQIARNHLRLPKYRHPGPTASGIAYEDYPDDE